VSATPQTIARTAAYFQNEHRTMRLRESCGLPVDVERMANARRLQLIEEEKLRELGYFLTHDGLLVELPGEDVDGPHVGYGPTPIPSCVAGVGPGANQIGAAA
jgi:hypothetical protein